MQEDYQEVDFTPEDYDPVEYKAEEWPGGLPGWYFWDETWANVSGPYPCEWMARGQLHLYIMTQLGEKYEL